MTIKKEGDFSGIEVQRIEYIQRLRVERQGLINRLDIGTITIKEGHKIANINPDGVAMEVPLTWRQIERRKQALTEINRILGIGEEDRPSF